jgi:Cu-Zn family superoxide dismutase
MRGRAASPGSWCGTHAVSALSLALFATSAATIGLSVRLAQQPAAAPAPAPPAPLLLVAANWTAAGGAPAPFSGSVVFSQTAAGAPVQVAVSLTGVPSGYHGFHVHSITDVSTGCGSAGHFNPYSTNHGFPAARVRHVGDLGNVFSDDSGNVVATFTDVQLSLVAGAPASIAGLTVVLHADPDDGVSQPTGNAGARLGCSLITPPASAAAAAWKTGAGEAASFAGSATFTQPAGAAAVTVTLALTGVSPGVHGLHIHAASDVSAGCGSSGHWNPAGVAHALLSNATRHAGDLGNVVADINGIVSATLTSELLSLDAASPANIENLVLVLHADADDGVSQPTGNAGARLGCSVIARR